MSANIRILQEDRKDLLKLHFPKEIGWKPRDVIKWDKIDENTVVLKRLQ